MYIVVPVTLTAHTLGACLRLSCNRLTVLSISKQTLVIPFYKGGGKRTSGQYLYKCAVPTTCEVSTRDPLHLPLPRSRHRFRTSLLYVCTFLLDLYCYSEHTGSRFPLNVRNLIRISIFHVAAGFLSASFSLVAISPAVTISLW
jgi:hypothetical protein